MYGNSAPALPGPRHPPHPHLGAKTAPERHHAPRLILLYYYYNVTISDSSTSYSPYIFGKSHNFHTFS